MAGGRHLAEVGQCQSCHTPVDARHRPLSGMAFAGGQEFVIDGVAYRSANITPDPSGDRALRPRPLRARHAHRKRRRPAPQPPSCPGQTSASSPTTISRRCGRTSRPSLPSLTTSSQPPWSSLTTHPKEITHEIHHFSIPARDPRRVAAFLAEVLGARVIPLPHPEGNLLVYAGDADGTAIEVWPAATRGGAADADLELRDLPLPEAWPHHRYVAAIPATPGRCSLPSRVKAGRPSGPTMARRTPA